MKECLVGRATGSVPLRGDPTASPWTEAESVSIDVHPWDGSNAVGSAVGDFPMEATARLLYDDQALYLQYDVRDGHQRATTTDLNGPVWTDSCVELFLGPESTDGRAYVNFEANCLGAFRLGFGPGRDDRRTISHELAAPVRVETSTGGSRKEPDPARDERWWLAAALPFDALAAFTGVDVEPSAGTVWRGNLQCCREDPAPAYAVWSPIDAPAPDFHRPEAFGRLVFE